MLYIRVMIIMIILPKKKSSNRMGIQLVYLLVHSRSRIPLTTMLVTLLIYNGHMP